MKYILRLKEWDKNRWSYYSYIETLDNGLEFLACEKFKYAHVFESLEEASKLIKLYKDNNFEIVDYETAYKDYYKDWEIL